MAEVIGSGLFIEPEPEPEAVDAETGSEVSTSPQVDHGLFIDPDRGLSDPFIFKFRVTEGALDARRQERSDQHSG